jgi:hypothetical protein
MTPTANALGFFVATLLMLFAGMSKKRIAWKPRNNSSRRRHKPPRNAP